MVKYTEMKLLAAMVVCILVHAFAFAGARFAPPQLPPSPYDDTEISTNVAFSAGDATSRSFVLSFDVDATPSNTVIVAFGTDSDSDGVLDWPETEFVVGWRCGGWFFRDKIAGTESFVAKESGTRRLDWRLSLDSGRSPRSLSATDADAPLGFVATPGMFRPGWNAARVTVRGRPSPSYSVSGGVFAPGLAVRAR